MDSKTTTVPGVRFWPTKRLAPSTGVRSGVWSGLTGVGTATMMNFASESFFGSAVNSTVVSFTASSPTSFVGSMPLLYFSIFAALKSKPMTSSFLANATAIGMPT